jgi:hypothetical protein
MDSRIEKFYAGLEHSMVIKNGTAYIMGRNDVITFELNNFSMDNWVLETIHIRILPKNYQEK